MAVKIASSKHLRTATELTLVAPIQAKFARTPANDSISYATRLGALLKTFFELRRVSIEKTVDGAVGPLERLRTLHNFSWSVFDGGSKLLLAVTFDRPWEPYIRAIVDQAGPFLDAIFCHCEGYEQASTEHGYVPFAAWVRQWQIDVSLFYAAEPDLTVDDQRYLREFERLYREKAAAPTFSQAAADLALGDPGHDGIGSAPLAPGRTDDLLRLRQFVDQRLGKAAAAMAQLRGLFHVSDPADAEQRAARRYFDRAAWMLLEPIVVTPDAVTRLPAPLGAMLEEIQATARAAGQAGATPSASSPAAAPSPALTELGEDVQANILTSYPRMTHGCLVLIGFDSAESARTFVGRMAGEVTLHTNVKAAKTGVNVALTYEGFRTLGLTEPELERFPIEFREGMAARAGSLGDVGEEHPERWTWPRRGTLDAPGSAVLALSEVDLLLTVQGNESSNGEREPEWGPEHPLYGRVKKLVGDDPGTRVLSVQPLQREFISKSDPYSTPASEGLVKERFGFADGLSQPVPAICATNESAGDRVALGEILLGHASDRGEREGYPSGPEAYTKNGSYLVVRQLEQDVEAFNAFIRENSSQFSGGAEALYTKIMGRRRDGSSPMARGLSNDFTYDGDPRGDQCPLASHVRRANPRSPDTTSVHGLPLRGPRLARRGFSYGPLSRSKAKGPRGLLFMAYNASLAEQFEVIQRWLNGANSTGVLSAHADPLVSHRAGQVITVLDGREPRYLSKKKPFVKLLWGHYFFAPSIRALQKLAALRTSADERRQAAVALRAQQGEPILQKLLALAAVEKAQPKPTFAKSIFQWKLLLEDRATRAEARAVWAAIREHHRGVLRTPYGVLVGDPAGVHSVLGDEKHFSVREYARRMQASVGLLHLGMERCPVSGFGAETSSQRDGAYAAAATLPNAFMYDQLGRGASFQRALAVAGARYAELAPYVDLTEFAKRAVADVCQSWFGLPRDRAGYDIHHTAALTIFYPRPDAAVEKAASELAQGLKEAKAAARAAEPPLAAYLSSRGANDDEIETALVGGAQGTLAATVGSFLNVANHCLENDRLGRLAAWLSTPSGQAWRADFASERASIEDGPIVREVLSAMAEQPAPDLLHRVVVAKTQLGGVELEPGDTVVISLGSAIAATSDPAERWNLLFGGAYPSEGSGPKHPCPGGRAAFGVIVGLLVALLERNVKRDGPLRVSADG